MTTHIINLYGGPGCGKSTMAARVFFDLKQQGKSVEMVREYVKPWVYRGEKIGRYDEIYLFGKQLRAESSLYGKVDYIVTDRPLGLSVVFERFYNPGSTLMEQMYGHVLGMHDTDSILNHNFLVRRNKPYVGEGRYEDEAGAKRLDHLCIECICPLVEVSSFTDVLLRLAL